MNEDSLLSDKIWRGLFIFLAFAPLLLLLSVNIYACSYAYKASRTVEDPK